MNSINLKRLIQALLFLFGASGMVASVVTVLQFFNDRSAHLEIKAYPSSFKMPTLVEDQLSKNKDNFSSFIKKLDSDFCKEKNNIKYEKHFCDHIENGNLVLDVFSLYSDTNGSVINYKISNTGSKIAEKIKLPSSGIIIAEISSPGGYRRTINKSDDYYYFPDLNPGETADIYIWTSIDILYYDNTIFEERIPKFTFSGNSINLKIHQQFENWMGIYDIFVNAPLLIKLIFLGIGGMIFWLPLILMTQAIDFLVKHLNKENPKKQQEAEEDQITA